MNILRALDYLLPSPRAALAHCDVPCGIYDLKPAQIASETIVKMVEKIESLPKKNPSATDRNLFVRAVWTKEEHARKCKEELLILWTDYFKPAHLEMFPDLHDTFWKAAKLCSAAKVNVSLEDATALMAAIEDIHMKFWATKNREVPYYTAA